MPAVQIGYTQLRRTLIAAYVLFTAGMLGATAAYLWSDRQSKLTEAYARTGTLARALEEHVSRAFGTVEVHLRNTARTLAEMGALTRPSTPQVVALLRERAAQTGIVRSIYAYDAAGFGHSTALDTDITSLRATDYEHTRRVLERGSNRLVIGRVMAGAVTGRPNIPVALGILDRSGHPAGIVGSSILPEYFAGFYKSLGLAEGGSVALVRRDGAILARFPVLPGAPGDVTQFTAFHEEIATKASGTVEIELSLDQVRRIISFRHIPDYDLIVAVTESSGAVLAPWRRLAATVGFAAVAVLFIFLALLIFSLRELSERKRSEQINAQLAAIVESSNDAMISRSPDRAILTWNAAAERLFGYTAAEVIGRNVSLLIPADQEARAAQGRALLEDGLPVSAYDAVRLRKDGRRIDVSVIASPIKDASGKMIGASLVFRDIGERKRAEVEHAQLAAIVESSNDAILIRGPDRTILSWNAAAERLFGWSAQEAVGQSIDLIVPRERIGMLQPFIERAARGESVSPVETTHLRKDGARIPTQITLSPVRDHNGNIVAHSYTVRDMSELKRKEETLRSYATRLRELSRRLREVEETERHAISRELHDRIGQELSTLTVLFGKLAARLTEESPGAVQQQLQDMQGLLKSTVGNVRDVMAELRPPVLDDYGLHAALRQLATEFAKHSGNSVKLIGVDLQPRLPSIVETALFRISQEALNNIARHARAKKVEISLSEASERVVLDIADDGVGFDAGETRQDGQHWGMITMRERAEAVGIAFRLESAPGAGTRVVLEVERAVT